MQPFYMIDHFERFLGDIQHKFRKSPNILALVTALSRQIQDLEDAFNGLVYERFIGSAIGAQLDQIGKIVGEPRDGLTDTQYRNFIRVRVRINLSNGTREELIWIVKNLTDALSVRIVPTYPAGQYIYFTPRVELESSMLVRIKQMVLEATGAGIGLTLVEVPFEPFGFDGAPNSGYNIGHYSRAF